MGKFLGETAGFAMLLLIWQLFLVMLVEFGIVREKSVLMIRKISLCVWGIGLGYLILGSFFYNISIDQAGVFQYDQIWGYGDYALIMGSVESGKCEGFFNAFYVKTAHTAGKIFFNQYLSAAIYVSFTFSMLYGLKIYFLIKELWNQNAAERLFMFFFFCPFAHKLFLPSPASMICFFAAAFFLIIWICTGKKRCCIKIPFRASDWLYNTILCIWISINIMLYYTEMTIRV